MPSDQQREIQQQDDFSTNNPSQHIPFARILYEGTLISIINSQGILLYSTIKGDILYGTSSTSLGHNILEFLLSVYPSTNLLLKYFQDPHNDFLRKIHQNIFQTRFGDSIIIEIVQFNSSLDCNSHYYQSSPSSSHERISYQQQSFFSSLLTISTSSDSLALSSEEDFSFNDAFE